MESEKDLVSTITKYIPIFTVLSLAYGTVHHFIFFNIFNINVFAFLELNEIVFQTFSDFIVICIYAFLFYLTSIIKFWFKVDKLFMMTANQNGKIPVGKTLLYMAVVLFTTLILLILGHRFNKGFIDLALILTLSDALFFINGIYWSSYKKLPPRATLFIAIFTFLVLSASAINGYKRAYKYKNGNAVRKTSVQIGDKLIESTASYYLIGLTNKWAFFYNSKSNTCDIFPIDKLDKLTL